MAAEKPTPTREADFDSEFNYVLFDYYMNQVSEDGLTQEEAVALYLDDMALGDDSPK